MSLTAVIRFIVRWLSLMFLRKRSATCGRQSVPMPTDGPGPQTSRRRARTRPGPRIPGPQPVLHAQRLSATATPPAGRTVAAPSIPRHPIRPSSHPAELRPEKAPRRLKSFLEKTLIARETAHSALLAVVLLAALLTACNPTPTAELHVFAAASLRQALTESADAFESHNPNIRIVANFAGSQVLRLQIESGARADLFISANPDHLDALHHSGLLAPPPTVVATNHLVLAVPAANPAGISGLQDLTQPNRRVVMATESVPAGAYARRMLALHAAATGQPGFAAALLHNAISFETNVRQVAAKLELGEADAGFVYRTDVLASHGRLHVIETPPRVQVTATYPAAVLRDAPNPDLAHRFLTFLRTPQAQAILIRHGFGTPA